MATSSVIGAPPAQFSEDDIHTLWKKGKKMRSGLNSLPRRRFDGGGVVEKPTDSVFLKINGQHQQVPTRVPGMSQDEIDMAQRSPQSKWDDSVSEKIGDHAEKLINQGQSPFSTQEIRAPVPSPQSPTKGGSIFSPQHEDQGDAMRALSARESLTPQDLAKRYGAQQQTNEAARARAMNESPQKQYARGGMVRPGQKPLRGYGSDTVPAALTPGEVVFNKKQLPAIQPRPGMQRKLRPDQLQAMKGGGKVSGLNTLPRQNPIKINPANRGKFNATKARTGKTTEELKRSPDPLTRKRATFAMNERKWHH
jgi:hypothetical protein